MAETAYRDELATAIMSAIVEASSAGEETVIPVREAGEALLLVLATLINGTESARTPRALRETAEAFARDLRVQVRQIAQIEATTGRRPFDAQLLMPN